MAFTYNSKDANDCLPEGMYEATIHEVYEDTSKSGNQMLVCVLTVYNGTLTRQLKDYIVNPSMIWKLKRYAQAFGREEQFMDDAFDLSEFVGKNLTVKLKIKSDPKYGDQNNIVGYEALTRQPQSTPAPRGGSVKRVEIDDDDSIPF